MDERLQVFHDLCEENGFLDIFDELMVYHKFFELVERFQRLAKKGVCVNPYVDLKIDAFNPKYEIEMGTYDLDGYAEISRIEHKETIKELVESFDKFVEEAEVAISSNKERV